ncbi:alpha-xylosidase [Nocardioides luteus]|uniref:alpha-D-xyloside xylohydrolase n=1 Tax=Nocardioides luteus TaxID=1844 RepID=A0A1J4N7V7_9ACTN|nr:alpha-xylosidase [Nocardioides luteus]OIJ26736.1 alpha-xylosidase [Nocardioides luteus]
MKFTDGFWRTLPGVEMLYAKQAYDIEATDDTVVVTAPTKVIESRGDTLNRPTLTVTLSSPLDGIIGVRIEHLRGARRPRGFELTGAEEGAAKATTTETGGVLRSGQLQATVAAGAPWDLRFEADGTVLTRSSERSVGYATTAGETYVHEQLTLGVGELVYGLGERFGPLVKNGQTVEVWNADGGTSSDQAYKNVPFYLTNRGYGVLVNHSGKVSFEVGSEAVERVQFSVPGESLEYFVIYGPTPEQILKRYTALVGRPARVPAWSYGLWLSTSFTTDYDEDTVNGFLDAMAERRLPLSVFHFDCFWMREFNWCDFEWDPRTFPDPDGMLERLHTERDLRVCVWINPYIAQRSPLFDEAAGLGYLVRRANGEVWQWDLWQAGMGLVDFTNPGAVEWFQAKLRRLIGQGVDCFKTDFGERIPTDVVYHDGSDPVQMHNWYTQLYNQAVHDVLVEERGEGEAVLFARSATVGGQRLPVHWGGDSTSSYESMAETLRGGLSLALSGFGFWSHDIGGFEGTPDAAVFKRWTAFGLLSSHSRLHGSGSYRVPWTFDVDPVTGVVDEGPQSAVAVTRRFTELKLSLMPYVYAAGLAASTRGVPLMRPLALAFPDDPGSAYVDRQYLLGPDLLVAPVFSADGSVDVYLPPGIWTDWWTGRVVPGGGWRREQHDFSTLPLYVRSGAVIPVGARTDRPDYDYLDDLVLRVFPGLEPGQRRVVEVVTPSGAVGAYEVVMGADGCPVVTATSIAPWRVEVVGPDSGQTLRSAE